jgi:thymidylate synthase ThyX
MAYLEQSTRYVPYTDRPGGRWKYYVPTELEGTPLRARYEAVLDRTFEIYARWFEPMQEYFRARFPKDPGDSDGVYRAAIRAKALDTLRGLLPAAVQSNMGLFGTGQAYEALLLRMRANPIAESREYADLILTELRKVIPAFLTRVDQPDRGVRWTQYLSETKTATESVAQTLLAGETRESRPEVTLTDFDPDGEIKVVAAALYAVSELPDDQLFELARRMSADDRASVLHAYVGNRANRRHKPGRAFERTSYRFDVLSDYGAFRDLQRHRLLTMEWQPLGALHGYVEPDAIEAAGAHKDWTSVMEASAELHDVLHASGLSAVAPYAVSMAYRIRYYMEMNAREAMHLIELRTAPQGHPAYRRICQAMHTLIAEKAGHRLIADAMSYADHSEVELERLKAERAAEKKRQANP